MNRPWKVEWRYRQMYSGTLTRWRCWATYKMKAAAEEAARVQQERWKHADAECRVVEKRTP